MNQNSSFFEYNKDKNKIKCGTGEKFMFRVPWINCSVELFLCPKFLFYGTFVKKGDLGTTLNSVNSKTYLIIQALLGFGKNGLKWFTHQVVQFIQTVQLTG